MSVPAWIVGLGARTPVGLTAPFSAAAVRASISRVANHPFMVDGRGNPLRLALDARIDAGAIGVRRMAELARSALVEAIEPLPMLTTLDVLLALPEERPGFSPADATAIARQLVVPGISIRVQPAERGHAGAVAALGKATALVAAGRAQVCAVIGVDSYLEPDTIDWLDGSRQIAAEDVRDGFVPGEGAGCVLVATRPTAKSLGLPCLAQVLAVQTAHEPNVIKGERETLGRGLSQAIGTATAGLHLPAEAIDEVYCDINGERYRTEEWVFTVLRVGAALRDTTYQTAVGSWGDVGAASGALLCVLAARAWQRRYAAGPRALVWCSSEGGLRAAAVLAQA
jgi:3-oxoacyl-[acyl-carrier-protein] synthase I